MLIMKLRIVQFTPISSYFLLLFQILPSLPCALKLTFIGPCIANIFSEYNQKDTIFLNLFISVRPSTTFRRFLRPSSGAQNCTYSVRYLSDHYCYLLLAAGRCMCSFELPVIEGKTV